MAELIVGSSTAPTEDAVTEALQKAADAAPTTLEEVKPEATEETPEVPEKFKGKSAAEIIEMYAALEKKVGAPKEETPAEDTADAAEGKDEEKAEETTEDTSSTPSAVVSKLNDIFTEKGEFGDDDYAMAEAAGFDRATVDSYVAGQKALAEAATQRITTAAGGPDQMERMFAWAKTGLTAAEITEYNASFQSSDVNAAEIAMTQLKAKYEAVNGRDAKLVSGKQSSGAQPGYDSWAQVTAAMNDPRYKTDPSYIASVQDKLSRSNPR